MTQTRDSLRHFEVTQIGKMTHEVTQIGKMTHEVTQIGKMTHEVTQIGKMTHEVTQVQSGGNQGFSGHQVRLRHFFSS